MHIRKRNAQGFALDGNHGAANGQSVYLWAQNANNENQQWVEIDRGNGYYSYQKQGTNHCLDGNRGGANRQDIYLWECRDNNRNQHWQKVSTDSGFFKLVKRNASGFAINGGSNGSNGQNVNLYDSSSSSQNLQWIITPIGSNKALESPVNNETIALYPNPVINTVTVQGAADAVIQVYDMNGKVVATKNTSSNNETIDLGGLTQGIYYVKIKGLDTVSTFKIAKQ